MTIRKCPFGIRVTLLTSRTKPSWIPSITASSNRGKVVVVGKKGGGVQGGRLKAATLLSKTMKDTIKQSIIMIYEATGKSIIQEKQGQSRSEYNFN